MQLWELEEVYEIHCHYSWWFKVTEINKLAVGRQAMWILGLLGQTGILRINETSKRQSLPTSAGTDWINWCPKDNLNLHLSPPPTLTLR